jgi:hypothetical protein
MHTHSRRDCLRSTGVTRAAALIIMLLAPPILLSACRGGDESPEPPETHQEKEARRAAKMADPDFGGSKDAKAGTTRPGDAPTPHQITHRAQPRSFP